MFSIGPVGAGNFHEGCEAHLWTGWRGVDLVPTESFMEERGQGPVGHLGLGLLPAARWRGSLSQRLTFLSSPGDGGVGNDVRLTRCREQQRRACGKKSDLWTLEGSGSLLLVSLSLA